MITWYIRRRTNSLRQRDTDNGLQFRRHRTLTRYAKIKVGPGSTADDTLSTTGILSYREGSYTKTISLGSGKVWVCTSDETAEITSVDEYQMREQVWEYFGPWEAAPDLG